VLWPGTPQIETEFDAALRAGLREGGFVEGKNFAFAMRYANADFGRLAPLAKELAALKPRVVVALSGLGVIEAHGAMPSVPLIMGGLGADPVRAPIRSMSTDSP
jgi:putative tryptophan/tyrosine transport system substrate-binding protein